MDNPSLNLRLSSEDLQIEGEPRQPLRVILDTHLKCSAKARVFNLPGPSLVVTASGDPTKMKQLRLLGVELERVSREGLGVNLGQAMSLLAAREINELQVEAGPILSGALIERGLVDEMVIYMAPHLMGDKARGLAQLSDVERMAERVKLKLQDVRMIGEDLRITAARAN